MKISCTIGQHGIELTGVGDVFADAAQHIMNNASSDTPGAKRATTTNTSKFTNEDLFFHVAANILDILQKNGYDNPSVRYAVDQALMESNNGRSPVSGADNNFSGIKYTKNSPFQSGKGKLSPEGDYYAHFSDMNAWAKDFIRILKMGNNPPISATSLADYVSRLKANRYFGAPENSYFNALQSIDNRLVKVNQSIPAQIKQEKQDTIDWANKQLMNKVTDINNWPLWGKIAGATAALFLIKKIFSK